MLIDLNGESFLQSRRFLSRGHGAKRGRGGGASHGIHVSNPKAAGLPVTSGLVLQMDAALGTDVTTDGAAVGSWTDQSTTGAVFTQATAGKKPILKLAQVNGRPALQFTQASTQYLALATIPAALQGNVQTICCVVQLSSAVSSFAEIISLGNDQHNNGVTLGQSSDTKWRQIANNTIESNAAAATNAWTRLMTTATAPGTSETLLVNGVQQTAVGNWSWTANTNTEPAYIGALGTSFGHYWSGLIAEIEIYNRVLSGAELASMDSYYKARYGLS